MSAEQSSVGSAKLTGPGPAALVCLEKEEPFCASSCPFHYDVREFTARLKRGSFNAAFRTFANGVGFPGIVAALCGQPCKIVCPRRQTDAAIDLRRLERAALEFAVNTKPNSYNLPPKEAKIAVVGAGLSGLGCALRLCNKKYHVTVFEQSDRVGGQLWSKLAPEIFLSDIETQFIYEKYDLCLNTKVNDISSLFNDFQAVYAAFDFGDSQEARGAKGPVFFAAGATDMEALAHGLRSASQIEAYLKTGSMKETEPHKPTRMQLDPSALTYKKPIAAGEGPFDKEQAADEAKRCIGCRCDACFRHCPMMGYFEKFPIRIADEVAVTITPGTLDGNGTVATRLISTCSQCGLCKEVCPQQIDMGDFLRKSHQAMRAKGAMPWVFHDFWLRDMAEARGPSCAFLGSPADKPRYLFFPGCQLGASEPRYALGAYALLRESASDTAILLGCCGAPAVWAGDEPLAEEVFAEIRGAWKKLGQPLMVLACPTCREMFAQYLPEIKTVFLLDQFAAMKITPRRAAGGEAVAVFDPCAARKYEESRKNVRALAAGAGYTVLELPYSGTRAQCCSYGGHMDITNPPYKEWLVNQRASASGLPYLVYCSNCRDVFAQAGHPAIHALELFTGCERESRQAPGIEQRLANRRLLKEDIVKQYFPRHAGGLPQAHALPPLRLAPGLADKLDKDRILTANVAEIITACEKTRRRLRSSAGHYVGHGEIGYMTYWVEYLPDLPPEDGYTVFNAYAHRMKIEEGY